MRSYGQYCSLAKSLDLIGDRWTLLVVRELVTFGAPEMALPSVGEEFRMHWLSMPPGSSSPTTTPRTRP